MILAARSARSVLVSVPNEMGMEKTMAGRLARGWSMARTSFSGLYLYAATGQIPPSLDPALVEGAFPPKS